jgi:hypothetical protein
MVPIPTVGPLPEGVMLKNQTAKPLYKNPYVLLGGAGLLAYLLLRKRK